MKRHFFLILVFLLSLTSLHAQNNLPGTWMGSFVQRDENGIDQVKANIVWRIHSIDAISNQVELTDMRQRFYDGVEIENPVKLKYKGSYTNSTLLSNSTNLRSIVHLHLIEEIQVIR